MLIVDRVKRSFGPVEAVRDVSFSVEQGTVLGLLGPNGAGKTTTMRMIMGIFPPDAGSVAWKGKMVNSRTRKRFGYLPEERGLYGRIAVRDQIVYFARLHGVQEFDARTRADAWLERLDIAQYAKRNSGELSKGNQQKVQLACALLHDPELVILDEPFSGLDPQNAQIVLDCIAYMRERGTAFVLSSHQMWQIEEACDRFCIIGAGLVRAAGTLAELRRDFPTRTVRVVPDAPSIRAAFSAAGYEPSGTEGDALKYELPVSADFGALLRAAVAAGPVESFDREEPALSAIYVRALGITPDEAAAA